MSCKNPWKCVTCGVCVCAEFRQQLTKVEQLAARVPALVINDLVKMHVGRAQDAHAKLQDEFQRTLDEINQKQVWATSLISDFLVCVCVCVCVCERERERRTHAKKQFLSYLVSAAFHTTFCLLQPELFSAHCLKFPRHSR